jgi:hypothetical protein
MSKRLKSKEEQDALLNKIPPGAKKVLVKTEKGDQKYKALEELSDSDEIQTNKAGEPVVMKASPGRRPNVQIAPSTPVVAEILRRKEDYLVKDPLLLAVRERPDDPDVLQQVALGLGTEAASLAFERLEAERGGKDTSAISTRRVKALTALGDTWLKRKDQIIHKGLDLNSPAFQAVLTFVMETVKTSMEEAGERKEMVETIFAKIANKMNAPEWEGEAKNRMK